MSTLYEVSVREIVNETTAVLDVHVVHPDSMYISPTPGFALMLLWEAVEGDAPLGTEVDLETALDEGWMRKYARGFVADVELVDVENELPPEAERDYDHPYWNDPDAWLRGGLRVRVTDPAWISHISQGLAWDSAAYEANSDFDACDPIRFEVNEPAAPTTEADSRAGLIPVPRVFFLDYLGEAEDDFIWFPKYSDKAYVPEEVYEGAQITDELLDSLGGEVVWYDSYGEGVGVLMPNRTIVHISSGSRGSTGVSAGSGKIGRARFNTAKKRLADPLTISGMARSADPVVVDATVEDSSVLLTVHCYDAGRDLRLDHAGNALALIAAPECHTFDGFEGATSKLARFLDAQIDERGVPFADQIFPLLAGGMIVESTVAKTRDADPVDFDALEGDALIAKLRENPWDTWTIRVVATDPAWVEHLPSFTPFRYGFNWVEDPQPWEGALLTHA